MYSQLISGLGNLAGWAFDLTNPVTWSVAVLLALICTSLLGPRIGWGIRWPFFFLNKLQWVLYNPLRWLFRTTDGKGTHALFLALLCAGKGRCIQSGPLIS